MINTSASGYFLTSSNFYNFYGLNENQRWHWALPKTIWNVLFLFSKMNRPSRRQPLKSLLLRGNSYFLNVQNRLSNHSLMRNLLKFLILLILLIVEKLSSLSWQNKIAAEKKIMAVIFKIKRLKKTFKKMTMSGLS